MERAKKGHEDVAIEVRSQKHSTCAVPTAQAAVIGQEGCHDTTIREKESLRSGTSL